MKVTRTPTTLISKIVIDADIDMNSYSFTEMGNITMVKNSGVQLLAGLAADGDWCGQTVLATAAEDISRGELVYLNTDGEVALADADSDATMPVKGIAIADVDADAEGVFLIEGFIRLDTWGWGAGDLLYAHTTAGAIRGNPPTGSEDMVQRIGIAVSLYSIWFRPDLTMLEVT